MPRFTYTAIDAVTRRERQGTVESSSAESAATLLRARGLMPTLVKLAQGRLRSRRTEAAPAGKPPARRQPPVFGRPVSPKQLAIFTRQLAMLLKAGLPLVRSLEVLGRQERNGSLRSALVELAAHLRSGGTLVDGLQQFPRIFDRLFIDMVKAGESGGVLEVVLERIAVFQEKNVRLRGRIKAALTYPLIIVLVATGIVAALMVLVVPKFEQIFAGMLKGQPLPMLTQMLLTVANFVRDHAVAAAGGALVLGWALVLLARTRPGIRLMDRLRLSLPVLGDLALKAGVARFTRTFGTLLTSGVPILPALTITRGTSGNVHLAEAIGRVHDRVKAGESVAGPLRTTAVFPDMVASMIEVGEETGALPEMLTRIADNYDEEVDSSVAALTSILEPLMIVVMAVMVGTIVIALFLPIVRIVQGMG
jgi:type IV pilus assembly protein PilC